MTTDDSLTPETIFDVPLPIINTNTPNTNTLSGIPSPLSNTPQTIKDAPIPQAPIANEVIGQSLDTAARRILGNFRFGQVGSLEVGNFVLGQSGDVRITPNGIIGRDSLGVERFTLDSAGELILRNGSNTAILDADGLISTANFPGAQVSNPAPGATTGSNSPVDVPGSTLGSITTTRQLKVLFFLTIRGYNDNAIPSDLADLINVLLYDSFLGGGIINCAGSGISSTHFIGGGLATQTTGDEQISTATILNVAPGVHNYKLQYYAQNAGTAFLDYWDTGFVVLGS